MDTALYRRIELSRKSKTELCEMWRQQLRRLGRQHVYGAPPEKWRKDEVIAEIVEMEAEVPA